MVIVHSENTLCYRKMSLITQNLYDICFCLFVCMRECVSISMKRDLKNWFHYFFAPVTLILNRQFRLNYFRVIEFNQCTFVTRYRYCFGFSYFLVSHSTQNSLTESVMSRWKSTTSDDEIDDFLCIHSNERSFIERL